MIKARNLNNVSALASLTIKVPLKSSKGVINTNEYNFVSNIIYYATVDSEEINIKNYLNNIRTILHSKVKLQKKKKKKLQGKIKAKIKLSVGKLKSLRFH